MKIDHKETNINRGLKVGMAHEDQSQRDEHQLCKMNKQLQ